jgi:hypothetical protein
LKIPFKIIFFMMFVYLLCGFEVSNAQDKSAVDVVNLFNSQYGGPDMDAIAGYTTAKFRLNRPKSVWVVDIWRVLKKMKYKRVGRAVVDSKFNDNKKAVILVEAKIKINEKETTQKEVYYLTREAEKWLIDDLVVVDGDIDLEKIAALRAEK